MITPIADINHELPLRIARGDSRALQLLYDELYRPLLFFAEGLIRDRTQCEDIVIEAFTKYWERRENFTDFAAVRSFLYTIVRNGCYRYYNQLEIKERHLTLKHANWTEKEDFVESRMVIAEMINHIRKEIDNLNPRYKDVIRSLFIEELTIQQTADRLGITVENVRKRKERGIDLLRNRIVTNNLSNLAIFYLIIRSKIP